MASKQPFRTANIASSNTTIKTITTTTTATAEAMTVVIAETSKQLLKQPLHMFRLIDQLIEGNFEIFVDKIGRKG